MTQNASAQPLLQQGKEQLDRGQHQAALEIFQQATALEPQNPQAWYWRGLACYRLKEYRESVEYLDRALEIKLDYILALARRGMAYKRLKQDEEAKADFEKAIEIQPQDDEDWRGKGLALDELGLYSEAIESYDKEIEINPKLDYAWYDRGVTLDNLGKHSEAIESYDRAIEINPKYDYAWYNRGIALRKLGKYSEAIESYDQAIEINPKYDYAWNNRAAVLCDRLRKYSEAIESFDQALEINPKFDYAWANRGNALRKLGKHSEAIESYDKALEINPKFDYAWNGRGIALDNLGKYSEAIESYDKALEINPKYDDAWYGRGNALRNLGKYSEAIESYDKALEINRYNCQAWDNRGVAIYYSKGYEAAIANWENALVVLKGQVPVNREGLGEIHYRIGRDRYNYTKKKPDIYSLALLQQVKESYQQARNCFQTSPLIARNLEVLVSLIEVCQELGETKEVTKLIGEGTVFLERLRESSDFSNREKVSLFRKFEIFSQYQVDELIHFGKTTEALEFAERRKNTCLVWLQRNPKYQAPPTTYQQIQQLLSPDTAAIYWHLSPATLTTFILKHDKPPQTLHEQRNFLGYLSNARIDTSEAANQLRKFQKWMQEWKQDYQDYRQDSPSAKKITASNPHLSSHPWRQKMPARLNQLRDILAVDRIIEHLGKVKQLILIPHRDLHLLPLHYLFPDCTITYLPSAQIGIDLQLKPNSVSAKQQLPFLIIQNLAGKSQLRFARVASGVISQIFQHSRPIETPNKTSMMETLGSKSICFHFSGHGYHNLEEPDLSALLLANDECLTLKDLFALESGSHQLVYLAACETGITGKDNLIDEFVGLASGFLPSKADYVISTLWRVEERSTALLTIRFYQLFQQKIPPAQALQQAQNWLRSRTYSQLAEWYLQLAAQLASKDIRVSEYLEFEAVILQQDRAKIDSTTPPFAHPYYWAGFTISGKVKPFYHNP